ncbi:hypothetical protein Pelsub_P1129 [Pelolinea submarina]|nr:hypothetical protein Pelsub_P1129 [Pelolinea submarina]
MALIGLLGGLLFAVGDLFVYLLPNSHYESNIYTDWANMNMWRFGVSLYLGCFGTILLLIGFYSFYNIVKQVCSNLVKLFCLILAIGVVLTSIGHFFIACIVPMTYKGAIYAGASADLAKSISMCWEPYIDPLNIFVMVVVILLQSIMLIGLIVKGKLNCPKWMIVLNPVGLIVLSIPVTILLNDTGLEGISDAFESLGESLMYLAVFWHWKRENDMRNRDTITENV